MALTFENLIAHNKRVSRILVVSMVSLLTVLAGLFALALTGVDAQLTSEVFLFGASVGATLALIGAGVSYFWGNFLVTGISNARKLSDFEDKVLFNVVKEMPIAAAIPMPQIYFVDDPSPNAFASGRDPKHALVGITAGLRTKLNREELQAVIAHEVGHIKNYDTRLMMLVGVFAGIIVLLSDLFTRGFFDRIRFKSGRRGSSESANTGSPLLAVIFIVGAILLGWLAPLLARVLQLAVSREREYLADATAVQLCRNPLALASALKKIALDPEILECDNRATEHMYIINPNPARKLQAANLDSVWSTHPPLIERLKKLYKLAGMSYDPKMD